MTDETRVLVLGAGSAGSRHARNLLRLGATVAVADVDEQRAAAVEGARVVPSDVRGLDGFDGIVVATPTAFHAEHAHAALGTGAKVLVEKPLAASAAELGELVAAADRLTVGYNLRLHQPVERLRDLLVQGRAGRIALVRVWFGSNLADWRPERDYRTTYSAVAALGGGVLLDASHELDLLVWLWGRDWVVDGAALARRSSLDIDVEDVAVALLRTRGGMPAVVMLDAVSRRYRRGVEVVGEDATVRLDWSVGAIEVEDASGTSVEDVSATVEESYRREDAAFLDFVRGEAGPAVNFEDAAASVVIADAIRATARRSAVPPA